MKSMIRQLLSKNSLSDIQCYALFTELGKATPIQQSIILTLLSAKIETLQEIMAARRFFLEQSLINETDLARCPTDMIDLVGTGGDGVGTFNISTAASIVVASCGVYVAKHGGGSVTSPSGSTNVITTLGIPTYQTPYDIIKSLHKDHYAFMCAPYFNPALNTFSPIRKQLAFPTIFNILGPLLNPLQPKRQVIGVYRRDLVSIVAAVLKEIGSIHALVVHAEEGLDELSVSGPNYVAEVRNHEIKEYIIDPASLGFPHSELNDVIGGTPTENAHIIQSIFSGQLAGPKRNVVILNAAAGLLVSGSASTLDEGITQAREAIVSGKTLHLLQQLKQGVQA